MGFLRNALGAFALASLGACAFLPALGVDGQVRVQGILLENDEESGIAWADAAIVLGGLKSTTVYGRCERKLDTIQVKIDGTLQQSVECERGQFTIPFTGSKAWKENGHYEIELVGLEGLVPSVTLKLKYELQSRYASDLLALETVPSATIYPSEEIAGTCHFALTLDINGRKVSCAKDAEFRESVDLALGANTVNFAWSDEYHNRGRRSFLIVRNPAGTPDLTYGMKSVVKDGSVALTRVSGGSSTLAPTLDHASVAGHRNGGVAGAIPLSLAPASGATGLTLSVGNQSYIFCESRDSSGACQP